MVVSAPVDAVTGEDIVITRFELAVTRLAASGRNLVSLVTRLFSMARTLDIDVT
jgi:hypothetical protein